jgi:flagellum-specific ATP synthase
VLVDGDDLNEPIADSVRGIMDGHVVLSRQIAERGRFPPVDVQRSLSRMLPDCHSPAEYAVMQAARKTLARYADIEELIRIGAYRAGTDPAVDASVKFADLAEAFLAQGKRDSLSADEAFAGIFRMLGEAGVKADLPAEAPAPAAAV